MIITIGGCDSSGGAGLIVDAQVARSFDTNILPIVSSLSAQTNQELIAIRWVNQTFFLQQLQSTLSAILSIKAIKIGLLANTKLLQCFIAFYKQYLIPIPIILDPIIVKGNGTPFTADQQQKKIIKVIYNQIIPYCTLIKPNHIELTLLTSHIQKNNPSTQQQINDILQQGTQAILLSGGHSTNDKQNILTNHIAIKKQEERIVYQKDQPRYNQNFRGTGCALTTAIACQIAQGIDIQKSINNSLDWLSNIIEKNKNNPDNQALTIK